MERYNPFSSQTNDSLIQDPDPFSNNPVRRQTSAGSQGGPKEEPPLESSPTRTRRCQQQVSLASRYSTTFPDPFGGDTEMGRALPPLPPPLDLKCPISAAERIATASSNRSSSATFIHKLGIDSDEDDETRTTSAGPTRNRQVERSVSSTHKHQRHQAFQRGATTATSRAHGTAPAAATPTSSSGAGAGLGSLLSRATSVTSSTVSDRVSGAVSSVRNAVDSFSGNIGSSGPASVGSAGAVSQQHLSSLDSLLAQRPQQQQPSPQQPQSAASYLASKLSSATNQLVGSVGAGASSTAHNLNTPIISRQRVLLIFESPAQADWAHQFAQYRRLTSGPNSTSGSTGATSSSPSTAFTSFLASQLMATTSSALGSLSSAQSEGGDLIEQADFADVSVLANQSSSTATVYVGGTSASNGLNFSGVGGSGGAVSSGSGGAAGDGGGRGRLAAALSNSLASGPGGGLFGAGAGVGVGAGVGGAGLKVVRPEFVIVRQRGKERVEHLGNVVKALHYCQVPMFEPHDIWSVFQDRQLIFARLLRVQKQLGGRENFPLMPQIFCQTHRDLLSYIANNSGPSSAIPLPYLVRTGLLGKGKLKIESMQMLRDFATIMATSEQSCTIEQYLEVKCDLIVQRLGTSLKLFRSTNYLQAARKSSAAEQQNPEAAAAAAAAAATVGSLKRQSLSLQQCHEARNSPAASTSSPSVGAASARQSSLGSNVLSSFISSTSSGLQQVVGGGGGGGGQARRASSSARPAALAFERLSEVGARYRDWIQAIGREFDNKLDAFCLKIVVASDDREYIVGLRDCSMDFLGDQENQDEDRRAFVELSLSKMNTMLPEHKPASRESSASGVRRRLLSDDDGRKAGAPDESEGARFEPAESRDGRQATDKRGVELPLDGGGQQQLAEDAGRAHSGRSHSVSMNQGSEGALSSGSPGAAGRPGALAASSSATAARPSDGPSARRSSDRTDGSCLSDGSPNGNTPTRATFRNSGPGLHQRQLSLGQSIFDQTSTALSSFQRQSLSFLRRLDSRSAEPTILSGTPPLSAKSDIVFSERHFGTESSSLTSSPATAMNAAVSAIGAQQHDSSPINEQLSTGGASGHQTRPATGAGALDMKLSQSMHTSSGSLEAAHSLSGQQRPPPPKPPAPTPPHGPLINRQSSLAGYSSSSLTAAPTVSSRGRLYDSADGPSLANSNRFDSAELSRALVNSVNRSGSSQQQRQSRVVRQNSALSAFEPYDSELRKVGDYSGAVDASAAGGSGGESGMGSREAMAGKQNRVPGAEMDGSLGASASQEHKTNLTAHLPFDAVSTTSGNSNSTDETTTAEDTMNNLKKTFASIFGDKCE